MKVVFISGSRHFSKLTEAIKERLLNIINQEFFVVVGDANGADKAVQVFLHQQAYSNVTVYCSGATCRNNIGNWPAKNIEVARGIKGRAFYTVKDKAMAEIADYGLVLWDGRSKGSFNNINELLKQQKKSLVYFSPIKSFFTVKSAEDLSNLASKVSQDNEMFSVSQQAFSF